MTLDQKKRTPEREQLAEAISAVAAAKAHVADLKTTWSEYVEKGQIIEEELSEARMNLEAEKFRARGNKVMRGGIGEVVDSIARTGSLVDRDVQDAEDKVNRLVAELDTNNKIRSAFSWKEQSRAENDVKLEEEKLQQAVYRVISSDPAIVALVERHRRLQTEANAIGARLSNLTTSLRNKVVQANEASDPAMIATYSEWKTVADRLRSDPDAAFPEIG